MSLRRHIPNTITLMNLLSGVIGVILVSEGRMLPAFCMMLAAACFDFADGLAARLLHAYSPLGKELDSLSDLVSFGVLPALMLYGMMHAGGAGWWRYCPLLIAAASALRLARFNLDTRQGEQFLGLPTPACALFCGSLAACAQADPTGWLAAHATSPVLLPATALALSALLVSEVPMLAFKVRPGSPVFTAQRTAFLLLVLACILATVLLRQPWPLAILLSLTAYLLLNLVSAVLRTSPGKSP